MSNVETGLGMVRQDEPEVICRGAEILSHSERTEAIEALLPLLRSRSERVRDCVCEALNQMDVAPLLLDWWRGGDDEKRALALGHAVALSHPGWWNCFAKRPKLKMQSCANTQQSD